MSAAAAVLAASMLAASAAIAQIAVVQGYEATLRWTPAAGSVSGYLVSVSRNGAPAQDEALVYSSEVMLQGEPGELIEVVVRPFSGNGPGRSWGPSSEPSDPIRFGQEPVVGNLYPLLDCASCRRFELREPNGAIALAVPHPTPGSWDLTGTGVLERGLFHALLRERATGTLMVGVLNGIGMAPLISMLGQGFATSTVSPPVDLDLDGVDEFLMHDASIGRGTVLGLEDGLLVELSRCDVQPGWRLIGSGDVDGDGDLDLWFDASQGNVVVIHLDDLEAVTSTFVSSSVSGTSPVDVADYDGDGRPDLLRRNNSTGALYVSLMRGNRSTPTQEVHTLAAQSGDANVVPRGSRELDGTPGAEVVLQNQSNGVIDIGHPVDPVPGRRERLASPGSSWRVVEVQQ